MNHKEHRDPVKPFRPCTEGDYERGFRDGKAHPAGAGIYCSGSQEYVRGFLAARKELK